MWRAGSLEKTLMLGKIEGRRRKGGQRRWLGGITISMDMSLGGLQSWWWTGRPGVLQSMRSKKVRHAWATELNWIKLHSLYTVKKTINKMKRQSTEWEKVCENHTSVKRLIAKIAKDPLQINSKKKKKSTNNSIKNGQRIWIDISPKETCRWPTSACKNAQHH